MCRWLVYFGDEKILMADLVTRPRNSIIQQSFDNPYLPFISEEKRHTLNHKINGDGFGVGWYGDTNTVPCVFTSIKPSWADRNLHRLAEEIWSKCFFAHIRAASPNSLIVENNCHPFQFGRILFMHNGCIAHFNKVKRKFINELSDTCFSSIQGSTDTEHCAALFIQNLPNSDPYASHSGIVMKEAMLKTMRQILKLTAEAADLPEPSSLNFAVTNGEVVIATRFRNSVSEEPPSLYYTKKLKYRCTEGKEFKCRSSEFSPQKFRSVVISSEPLTYNEDDWALIPKNHMMIVTAKHKVILEPIDFESDLFFNSSPPKTDNFSTMEPYFGFPKSLGTKVDSELNTSSSLQNLSESQNDLQKDVTKRISESVQSKPLPTLTQTATAQPPNPGLISVQINFQVSKDFTLHFLVSVMMAIGIFMLLRYVTKADLFC
mmetsp:Transcript_29800/g.41919  ORF Transcript_29800/g.41919 Transcript_29800/m.41919 type:complete len:432 (+) Transcript_29800:68-1363(+)